MRVLDLSRLLPGPYCSQILVDFGCEVIKVERPGEGDWVRSLPPFKEGISTLFQALNNGKKSLTLDLKSEGGREIFLKFVVIADVLLESFRPGVMARLGLDYERLSQANPRLVYCSLTGFGDRGAYRDRPGHDLNYIGLSGLLDLTGGRDRPPVIPRVQIADIGGALWALIGIQQALLEREGTWGRAACRCIAAGRLAQLSTSCEGSGDWQGTNGARRQRPDWWLGVLPGLPDPRRQIHHLRGVRAKILDKLLPGGRSGGSG